MKEADILLWIQEHLRTEMLDPVMQFITHLGDMAFIWIIFIVLLCAWKRTRLMGVQAFTGLAVSFLINNVILKNVIARVRPYEAIQGLGILVDRQSDWSFPSGHSASSFVVATIIWFHNRKMGTAALALAGLIAVSRLYVGVHYPTDVLAGTASGIVIGAGVHLLWDKVFAGKGRNR